MAHARLVGRASEAARTSTSTFVHTRSHECHRRGVDFGGPMRASLPATTSQCLYARCSHKALVSAPMSSTSLLSVAVCAARVLAPCPCACTQQSQHSYSAIERRPACATYCFEAYQALRSRVWPAHGACRESVCDLLRAANTLFAGPACTITTPHIRRPHCLDYGLVFILECVIASLARLRARPRSVVLWLREPESCLWTLCVLDCLADPH